MASLKALGSKLAWIALAASGLAIGCKSKPLIETSTTAYIIGINDIKTLTESSRTNIAPQPINASVLLATRLASKKTKFCSGTLVEPEAPGAPLRILTNHHCFAEMDQEGKALVTLLPEACIATNVYFGFEAAAPQSAFETACLPGSLRTDYNGDLAVFSLKAPPPEKHQPLKFFTGNDLGIGRRSIIIHHPDVEENAKLPPDGGVRLPTAAITTEDCMVIGVFSASEWDLDRTLPFSLRHSCDLIHGSSGSALVDAETGTIIGVNWGGIKITQGSDTRTENVATRGDYAVAFLARDLDNFLKAAPHQRPRLAASSDAVQGDPAQENKKSKKDLVSGLKGRACGTLGNADRDGTPSEAWALLLVLALPFGIMVSVRPT